MATAPHTYRGRGVWYFDGAIQCPLAGIGGRGPFASNRVVIEDERATVTLDRDRHRIDVTITGTYPTKALVADLTFLGDGTTAAGATTPLAIHLEIFREGDKLVLDLHRHLRVQDKLVDAAFEPYTVVVDDGRTRTTVLDRQIVLDLVRKPSLTHRLIKAMMAMKDHAEHARQDLTRPGFAVADFEMGFGVGPLTKMLVRARLTSLQPAAALTAAGTAGELLAHGGWELELTALAEKYINDVIKRDLMLFGLEDEPLLAPIKARGLARGQKLAFRFDDGVGSIRVDATSAPMPAALDVARAYLEYHMLGGLLAEHAERFVRRLPAR
ncbi:MAG: hypothetical protein IPL61_29765 [Myxococcales bacterium]|nr:hypothetical protein [Myxococcales bacterium]